MNDSSADASKRFETTEVLPKKNIRQRKALLFPKFLRRVFVGLYYFAGTTRQRFLVVASFFSPQTTPHEEDQRKTDGAACGVTNIFFLSSFFLPPTPCRPHSFDEFRSACDGQK